MKMKNKNAAAKKIQKEIRQGKEKKINAGSSPKKKKSIRIPENRQGNYV